ncbi:MAG: FapA family protein [Lachnospiraceae bacterium]|nr:FapA family protein [Lachnospiraceae bacterium]
MIIKEPVVRIAEDDMEAYLYLPVPADITREYSMGELIEVLKRNQVISGIDQKALLSMVKGHVYLKETLIASGKEPVDGADGYYRFFFESDVAKNEAMPDSDGNINYDEYKNLEIVNKGEIVAEYVSAVQGTNGYTVKGRLLQCKRGKELPPLKGIGITKDETNGRVYFATESGRVDIIKDRIMIHPVVLIKDDLNRMDAPLDVKGDVVIRGNVDNGAKITATGTVTVDGLVYGAEIDAGGDLLVRGGISGNNAAVIEARGNVVAKFIEHATVKAEGTIKTDIIMDSDVFALEKISVTSGKGTILGGMVHSVVGIEANDVGNNVGLKTFIRLGVAPEDLKKIMLLNKENAVYEMSIANANEFLKACEEREKNEGISMKDNPERLEILKTKIKLTSKQALARAELKVHMEHMAKSSMAKIVIHDNLYAGTTFFFEDLKLENTNQKEHVFVRKLGKKLKIDSLY